MSRPWRITTIALLLFGYLLIGCSTQRSAQSRAAARGTTTGTASYYGAEHHGRKTASGTVFDMHQLTAAHRTLAFGQRVRVTNLDNGRSVEVVINDRGPFVRNRIIDLSEAAARKLDMIRAGTAKVRIEVLKR